MDAFEIIYGRNPVREALRGGRRVRRIWVLAGRGRDDLTAEVASWVAAADVPAPLVSVRSPEELAVAAGSPDHQGVVAEVDAYGYASVEQILGRFDLVVALDRVQDPHNLGAIVRTAEVAGAAVVIPRHRTATITAAVVKASAGATEHAAVANVRNLTDFLLDAKKAGFWVYGADAAATSLYDAQGYRGKTVFVVGSEGEGLGRRVAQACDVLVSIPQLGRVGSLNVSVSAGVLLFEALRQRRRGEQPQTKAPTGTRGPDESRGRS